jgi:hypothetical protein
MTGILIAFAMLAQPPAGAPAAAPACAAIDQALPPALTGWRSPTPIAGSALAVGAIARVKLAPDPHFAITSSRGAAPGTFGAAFSFTVDHQGTYYVVVSDNAWVDVVTGGSALRSVTHGPGPACTSVRRIIGYSLAPGAYSLQISGSHQAEATIAIDGSSVN